MPEFRITAEVAVTGALAVWSLTRLGRQRFGLEALLFVALFALVVVSLASRDVRGSLETVGLALAYVLLFLAVRDASHRTDLRQALASGAFLAVTLWLLIIAIGWIGEKVIWLVIAGGVPPADPFATFLWESPNVPPFLTLLGIGCLPWLPRNRWIRLAMKAFWLGSVVVVPLSAGRAGWLGIAIVGVAYLLVRRSDGDDSDRWSVALRGRRLHVLAGAAAGALLLALAAGLRSGAFDIRFLIWEQAWAIFQADPLTGGGPSTFPWLRLEYLPAYAIPTGAEHPHNIVMATLADGGLLLLAAAALVVGAYGRTVAKNWQVASNRHRLGYAVLIGFAAASLLDDLEALNSVFGLAIAIAAWSLPDRRPAPSGTKGMRLALLAASAAVFAVSALSVVTVALTRLEADAGRAAYRSGDYSRALERFSNAASWYPERAAYSLGQGAALAQLDRPEDARRAFLEAARLSPGDPRGWAAAASLARATEIRIAELRHAAPHANGDAQYPYRLAEQLEEAGAHDEAVEQYALASLLRPSLLYELDPAELQQVVERLPGVMDAYGRRALISPSAFEANIDLIMGEVPNAAFPGHQAIYHATHGDAQAALLALERAAEQDPHATATWAAFAATGELLCDEVVTRRGRITLSLLRERARFAVTSWDWIYREDGLGDYQVIPSPRGPVATPPYDLVETFPDCR